MHPRLRDKAEGQEETPESMTLRRYRPLEVHGVRLIELTERESSVMSVAESAEYSTRDPIVNTFRTFGQLNNVAVSGGVVVVPERTYADTIVSKASDMSSDLVLIPWSETGGMSEQQLLIPGSSSSSTESKFASGPHTSFIGNVLKNSTSNVGIFVNRGFGGPSLEQPARTIHRAVSGLSIRSTPQDVTVSPIADRSHHIFFPYLGGADDRFALRFVLQLAQSEQVTATIVHFEGFAAAYQPKSAGEVEADGTFFHLLRDSLPATLARRVVFQTISTAGSMTELVDAVLLQARSEVGVQKRNGGDLIVVGRHWTESSSSSGGGGGSASDGGSGGPIRTEAGKALGVLGEAVVGKNGVPGSLLVMQSRG